MVDSPGELQDKILVVGQDKFVVEVLRHQLERLGYSLVVAEDGRRVSQMIDELSPPELVVTSLDLCYRNGLELIDKMRESRGWGDVSILVLSRKRGEETIVRAFRRGADDYLTVPFKLGELTARIDRLVGRV